MTYRNIMVDGQTYKYVIGKKFTKVVDVGHVLNADLGAPIGTPYNMMSEVWRAKFSFEEYQKVARFMVRPADIRRYILAGGEADPRFHNGPHVCSSCKQIKDDAVLRADPYDSEIYGKHHYAYTCDACDHASWMNT